MAPLSAEPWRRGPELHQGPKHAFSAPLSTLESVARCGAPRPTPCMDSQARRDLERTLHARILQPYKRVTWEGANRLTRALTSCSRGWGYSSFAPATTSGQALLWSSSSGRQPLPEPSHCQNSGSTNCALPLINCLSSSENHTNHQYGRAQHPQVRTPPFRTR